MAKRSKEISFNQASLSTQVIIAIARLHDMGYRAATSGLWRDLITDYLAAEGIEAKKRSIEAYVQQLSNVPAKYGVISSFYGFLYPIAGGGLAVKAELVDLAHELLELSDQEMFEVQEA